MNVKKNSCVFISGTNPSTHNSNENVFKNSEIKKSLNKISTGCGPSPPREIIMQSSMSMGTSPPPQSISTQVSFVYRIKLNRFYFFHFEFKDI